MQPKTHHFAYSIAPGSMEFVLEVFQKLGYELDYREGEARWCLLGSDDSDSLIQLIESDDARNNIVNKMNTHIGFVSDDPARDVAKVESFVNSGGRDFQSGQWSPQELWFDLPGVFNNFVVEIMDKSVLD